MPLAYRRMRVLVVVLVVFEFNEDRWGHGRWIEWFSILIASIFINYLQYIIFLSLSDKESVIVSPVIPAYTLRKKAEIKAVSVLTKLPC